MLGLTASRKQLVKSHMEHSTHMSLYLLLSFWIILAASRSALVSGTEENRVVTVAS